MADEFVYIRLKEHGDDVLPGRVTRRAYEDIYQAKGFVIVDNDEAQLMGSPATVAERQAALPASEQEAAASEQEAAASGTTKKKG